jgi:ABC-2 type transport system permease protein
VLVTVGAIGVVGFLLAVTSVRYRTAWALGSTLELPIWLISGFLVPLAALPDWVRPISWVLSPTWGMAAVRAAAEGRSPAVEIAICLALTVAYGVGASWLARRLVDSARAHATLALS